MTSQRKALERQLERAERVAQRRPDDQEIAKVVAVQRSEVEALGQGGSAGRAEAMAALARQYLNVCDRENRAGGPLDL